MRNPWAVLVLVCLARASMTIHTPAVAALAPFLIADLGLDYRDIGLLIGVASLPGALVTLPGAALSRRFGDKALVVAGLALQFLGAVALALSPALGLAVAARLLGGTGTPLFSLQATKILTDRFVGQRIATGMACLLAMLGVGVALALLVLPALAILTSWRAAGLLAAGCTGLALAAFALLYRNSPASAPSLAPVPASPPIWTLDAREVGLMLLIGTAWAALNAAWIIFISFAPALLVERGLSASEAGALVSWTPWTSIAAVPLAGLIVDRFRHPARWAIGAGLVAAAVCLALPLGGPPPLWSVLFALAAAPVVVGVQVLPAEVLRPQSRATGLGVFNTLMYAGMGICPLLAGNLVSATGTAAAALWFAGLLWLAVVPIALAWLAIRRRDARLLRSGSALEPARG